MARKGLVGDEADAIYLKILSFANFGFAESHALSFALLVYASSWFKLHYPAAFLAALLRNQPMGFYSPQSLTHDARRHGVEVLRPDLVALRGAGRPRAARATPGARPGSTPASRRHHAPTGCRARPTRRRSTAATAYAVRLGLDEVRGIGTEVAERIVAAREERPFARQVDLSRRAGLDARPAGGAGHGRCLRRLRAVASSGAVERGLDRARGPPRGDPASARPRRCCPDMDVVETTMADLWATRITPDVHPIGTCCASSPAAAGILAVGDAATAEAGRRVHVAGLITHRQRPGTAGGVTFLNLEDETGMLNVICTVGVWRRYRAVAANSAGMVIRGILERQDGVTNLVADRLAPIEEVHPEAGRALRARHRSRDFQ